MYGTPLRQKLERELKVHGMRLLVFLVELQIGLETSLLKHGQQLKMYLAQGERYLMV